MDDVKFFLFHINKKSNDLWSLLQVYKHKFNALNFMRSSQSRLTYEENTEIGLSASED